MIHKKHEFDCLAVNKRNKTRAKLTIFIFFSFIFIVIVRLFFIQILYHEYYKDKVLHMVRRKNIYYGIRGNIYDRNYKLLSESIGEYYSFGINTKYINDKKEFSKRIGQALNKSSASILQKLKKVRNKKDKFIWIDSYLSFQEKESAIDSLKGQEYRGFSVRTVANRVYRQGKNVSQILGYVDAQGDGKSGIEKRYDKYLRGEDGWEFVYTDAKQKITYNSETKKVAPKTGNHIVLTINSKYQDILQQELSNAYKKWKAKDITGVIIRPQTGEILAMGTAPFFDPNNPGEYNAASRKNSAIANIYEPGSTIKPLTAAALLEERKVKVGSNADIFFCDNDGYVVADKRIRDDHKHENQYLTMSQIISTSSNIGIVKAVERIDSKTFYRYMFDFGFGSKTGVGLTGEVGGILPELKKWNGLTKVTMSYGHGMSITPLQLAMAYGAISNGGILYRPYVVKKIIDNDSKLVKEFKPLKIRSVISSKTAKIIRNFLRGVVASEHGTARGIFDEELNYGGKTGTARKVVNGRYSRRDYDASFAGIFPFDNPQLVCVIVANTPRGSIYGSSVAAPVFKNVIKRIYELDKKKFMIENIDEKEFAIVPSIEGLSIENAKKYLSEKSIKFVLKGNNIDTVRLQYPQPYECISFKDTVFLYGNSIEKAQIHIGKMPDLYGKSVRKAVTTLFKFNIQPELRGKGYVYKQSIKVGSDILFNKKCILYCSPRKVIEPKVQNGDSLDK